MSAVGPCSSGNYVSPHLTIALFQDLKGSVILLQGQDASVVVSVPSLSGYDLHDAAERWVKSYQLHWSVDGKSWSSVEPANNGSNNASDFSGCRDSTSFTLQHFASSITARYFRVLPTSYEGAPVLRVKLFGTSPGVPLGLQSESIADD